MTCSDNTLQKFESPEASSLSPGSILFFVLELDALTEKIRGVRSPIVKYNIKELPQNHSAFTPPAMPPICTQRGLGFLYGAMCVSLFHKNFQHCCDPTDTSFIYHILESQSLSSSK